MKRWVLILLVFASCTATVQKENLYLAQSEDDPSYPVKLRITNELHDGSKLHVSGEIEGRVWWDVTATYIHLKILENGKVIGESLLPVANLIDEDSVRELSGAYLRPHEVKQFRLSSNAEKMTDYQLEVLWGDDAASAKSKIPLAERIVIQNVAIKSSKSSQAITGVIVNRTETALTDVRLSVEFVWVPTGSSIEDISPDPENVQILTASNLGINPNQARNFSIELDPRLPVIPKGEWEARVSAAE